MMTDFLRDAGEEHWAQKWHIGNGGIYLAGYINCDIQGVTALEHPDLKAQNTTTIDNYYARLEGDPLHLPTRRATVVDLLTDAAYIGALAGTIDKIIAIQVFEHLTPVQAIEALGRWHRALKYSGPIILSVPDMLGTLEMLESDSAEVRAFALRHLRGRMGDKPNTHHAWYTRDTLKELLDWQGFDAIDELPNFHFYPAIVLKAYKA